jgi:ATP-dependent Clp protease protease subunit
MADNLQSALPEGAEAFGAFCSNLDSIAVARIFRAMTAAINDGVQHMHLLFQSPGGSVGDGICLYNFFRTMPIDLTVYNVGSVRSAGTLAYLGARNRRVSRHAAFMVHRCLKINLSASGEHLKAVAEGLLFEDVRIENILREHLLFAPHQWSSFDRDELVLSSNQAVEAQLADGIVEFSPPRLCRFYEF